MTPTQLAQTLVVNVILGITAAVVVFEAEVVPAVAGGIAAGILILLHARVHAPRRPRNFSRRE